MSSFDSSFRGKQPSLGIVRRPDDPNKTVGSGCLEAKMQTPKNWPRDRATLRRARRIATIFNGCDAEEPEHETRHLESDMRVAINGFLDTMSKEADARTEREERTEAEARKQAEEATASLGNRYVGFEVVTPRESDLLRWAKMQVEIRRLQWESQCVLQELTNLSDPDPNIKKILR